MSHFTQGHALLIGTGADLPYPAPSLLPTAWPRGAYPAPQALLLTGEPAKDADILTALDQLTTGERGTAGSGNVLDSTPVIGDHTRINQLVDRNQTIASNL